MPKKLKNLFLKPLSLLLCLSIFISNLSPTKAKANNNEVSDYLSVDYYAGYESLNVFNADVEVVFDTMSDDAKTIFIHYMKTMDNELYEYHLANVGLVDETYNYSDTISTYGIEECLKILSAELNKIGLSDPVKYALMGSGSSIVAAIGDGGLLVGDIVAILCLAGTIGIMVANWSSVSGHWDEIAAAFKAAFQAFISTSTMGSALSTTKTNYVSEYTVLQQLPYKVRNGSPANSFSKHIDLATTIPVVQSQNPIGVYCNTSTKVALFVYTIRSGTFANLNSDYYAHATWQLTNFNISGAKIFVLYNYGNNTLFHVHLRLFRDDTEAMRYGNRLPWQVSPYMLFDSKYLSGGSTWLNGDIYSP